MNTSESNPTPEKNRLKWPIKTLIEVFTADYCPDRRLQLLHH